MGNSANHCATLINNGHISQRRFHKLWAKYDTDGDGKLNKKETKTFLTHLFLYLSENSSSSYSLTALPSPALSSPRAASETEISKIGSPRTRILSSPRTKRAKEQIKEQARAQVEQIVAEIFEDASSLSYTRFQRIFFSLKTEELELSESLAAELDASILLEKLSTDILLHVFSFIFSNSMSSFRTICLVSKQWNALASRSVKRMDLRAYQQLTPEKMQIFLGKKRQLHHLNVAFHSNIDAQFASIVSQCCPNLRSLNVAYCTKFNGTALKQLKLLHLSDLASLTRLSCGEFGGKDLALGFKLAETHNLTTLILRQCPAFDLLWSGLHLSQCVCGSKQQEASEVESPSLFLNSKSSSGSIGKASPPPSSRFKPLFSHRFSSEVVLEVHFRVSGRA
eukprot:TRINITY_DN5920_c0_g1_i1.p1 TRINITY_DN5920_c0_g1~~TRINITY_DN5920_c0_g1_i1.p1  ORF type:complete len:395 (-),score=67.68 TRINITY_DN5920_c0_g1_i1:209-1393(-)